jgi:hypothetical protein
MGTQIVIGAPPINELTNQQISEFLAVDDLATRERSP